MGYTISTKCQTLSNTSEMTFFSFRKTAHWCTCIVHATQSNCYGTLNFLSPEPCPQQPELNALITRFRESYSSVSMSRESKGLKKSRTDWLNSGSALIQYLSEKMHFVFSLFATYCRSTSYLWLLTLSVTFLPKNIKICSRVSKL